VSESTVVSREEVRCHLCGSWSSDTVIEGPDRMFPSTEIFRFIRCNHCGLIYLDPQPTKAELGRYYPQDYAPHSDSAGKHMPWVKRWAHRYGIRKRQQVILAEQRTPGRLLDVGCATGTFLAAMRDVGWDVRGVELSAEVAARARQWWGVDVYPGELAEAGFGDEYFDAVTLWDTLEHVHQPLAVLREVWRILKPDGMLALRTPNVHSVNLRLFGPHWGGWDMPRHLYIFPLPTLRQMLTQCAFEDVRAFSPAGTYADFVISLRFLVNARVEDARWRSLCHRLIHPLLIQVALSPYFYWADKTVRGAHVTVVARKPPTPPSMSPDDRGRGDETNC